jgi:hypothetical protein
MIRGVPGGPEIEAPGEYVPPESLELLPARTTKLPGGIRTHRKTTPLHGAQTRLSDFEFSLEPVVFLEIALTRIQSFIPERPLLWRNTMNEQQDNVTTKEHLEPSMRPIVPCLLWTLLGLVNPVPDPSANASQPPAGVGAVPQLTTHS